MSRMFVLPSPKRRMHRVFTFLAPGEFWIAAVAAVASVLCLAVFRLVGVLPVLAIVASAAFFIKAPYRGRTRYLWWETRRAHRRLQRTGEASWATTAGWAGFRGPAEPVDVAPAPPGIGRVAWSTVATARGDIAMIHQLDEDRITVAVEVAGEHTFVAADEGEQLAAIERFERLLVDLGKRTEETGLSRVAWVAKVIPEDPQAHLRYLAEVLDDAAPALWRDSYLAVNDAVQGAGETQRCWCVASIDVTAQLLDRARSLGGHGDTAVRRVVGETVDDLVTSIETLGGLRVLSMVREGELSRLIASTFDPRERLEDLDGASRQTAWPAAVDATPWDHVSVRAIGQPSPVCIATAWFASWPARAVPVNFLRQLLIVATTQLPRTTVVVMDLVPTGEAYLAAQVERTAEIGEANARAAGGEIDDPMSEAAAGRKWGLSNDLANGAVGVNLAGWVSVAGRGVDELNREKRIVRAACTEAGVALEWCDGEQYRALANILPFARGLLR